MQVISTINHPAATFAFLLVLSKHLHTVYEYVVIRDRLPFKFGRFNLAALISYYVLLKRNYSIAVGGFWPVSLYRWHTECSRNNNFNTRNIFLKFPLSLHQPPDSNVHCFAKLTKTKRTTDQRLTSERSRPASIDII